MLQLQREIGNQAVLSLLRSGAIQAKLAVGGPDDPEEKEADEVADKVMRKPSGAAAAGACTCAAGGEMCEECQKKELDQTGGAPMVQRRARTGGAHSDAPSSVQQTLGNSGRPLESATRSDMESRFGYDFGGVRIHTDRQAADSAKSIDALAYTFGGDIVFGAGQYAPHSDAGQRLLAHELAHVVQQRTGQRNLQRRAANCPAAPPSPPTITTMADFIALVQRVEASTSTGSDPIAIARLISRTKYEGPAWEWLLPTTKGKPGVVAGGNVTADDIGSLCFKLIVSIPGGGMEDPMHVVAAIVAEAETLPAGTGATGLSGLLISPLPASVSQRGVSTWVGDVGKAAGDWMAIFPLAGGGSTKADYMQDSAPPHDLMADVDGVAVTSKSASSGFAFDKTKPLSDNLQRFFTPAKGTGRERRFHVFCSAEGFALEGDRVTLTAGAKATIGKQVQDFADWYTRNDPHILAYLVAASKSFWFSRELVNRAGDWQWFTDRFIDFVQKNLTAEGP